MTPQSTDQAKGAYNGGDWVEAERLCRSLLGEKPNDFDALNLLGIIAAQTQRPLEAIELLSLAITVNPNHDTGHSNLGNLLLSLGRLEDALESFDRALNINPRDADTLYNRGSILGSLARYEEALESCNRALAIKPDFAEALNVRGNALGCLKRSIEALESFAHALQIKPDYAAGFNNQGIVLRDLKRFDEALESYRNALEISPDYAEAIYNYGMVLSDLARHKEAVDAYEKVLNIKPDYVEANWNVSLCHLLLGNFKRGWEKYEWRWKEKQLEKSNRDFPQQLWLGVESLKGKTILLHGEAGYGDTLQFCRYAKLVAAMGARVILEVQPPLAPLLSNLEGTHQVLPKGGTLPAFDYHCPLLSLPLAFKTDLDTIPADIPYINSDAARVAVWRDKLGKKTKPRIGLVWSGNPKQKNDHNRSLALAELLPLLHDEAEWISLQQEVRAADIELLAQRTEIRHFGEELKDFADTAALIELMDVVVTVCTSVAHLAGAMGKPTWILLCFNADWRWLLDRSDSPWYPTSRLFRQTSIGNWESVVNRMRQELMQQYADSYPIIPVKINANEQIPRSSGLSQRTCTKHTQDYSQLPVAVNSARLLIYLLVIGFAATAIWLLFS